MLNELIDWRDRFKTYKTIKSSHNITNKKCFLVDPRKNEQIIGSRFRRKSVFLAKIVPFFKAIAWELWERIFSSIFIFCEINAWSWWKHIIYRPSFQNPVYRLLQIHHKLDKAKDVKICRFDVVVTFFWCQRVSLVRFS